MWETVKNVKDGIWWKHLSIFINGRLGAKFRIGMCQETMLK